MFSFFSTLSNFGMKFKLESKLHWEMHSMTSITKANMILITKFLSLLNWESYYIIYNYWWQGDITQTKQEIKVLVNFTRTVENILYV